MIVDLDRERPRFRTAEEIALGYQTIQRFVGPLPERFASEPRQPTGRGAVARADDPLKALSTPELLAKATAAGYQDHAAPNEGVRRMRLLNFLRRAKP